ncbi:MAG: deoxyribonuclease V [Armatimonadota bacterium]
MEYTPLHSWDMSIPEAQQVQHELRSRLVLAPPSDFNPRLVAGADVSTTKFSPIVYAGFVVIDIETMESVATSTAITEVTFPYIPGLLSFREIPALVEAWRQLQVRPDVLVMDGHGTAHPRGMGVACHAGLVFGVPTIGCAKSILVGKHAPLEEERGSMQPLIFRGEKVGVVLRTKTGVSPVYVSPGDHIDSPTAVELVLRLTPGGKYRLPETTRRAHRLVNDLRVASGD